jgi:hypothetical protein
MLALRLADDEPRAARPPELRRSHAEVDARVGLQQMDAAGKGTGVVALGHLQIGIDEGR